MKTNKRLITKYQETVLRLVHHDFEGLTRKEAAARLHISQSTLSRVLAEIKRMLPEFFPILTKLETETYHCYMDVGWKVGRIAEHMQRTKSAVYGTLRGLRKKGKFFSKSKSKNVLAYDPGMDDEIKQKF